MPENPTDLVNVRYLVGVVAEAVDFYTSHLGFTRTLSWRSGSPGRPSSGARHREDLDGERADRRPGSGHREGADRCRVHAASVLGLASTIGLPRGRPGEGQGKVSGRAGSILVVPPAERL